MECITAIPNEPLDIKKELGGKGYLMHIVNETLTLEEGQAFIKAFEAA